ncbi:uncharacterized protein LOC144159786, partial [Haemaphysalis longicornis]
VPAQSVVHRAAQIRDPCLSPPPGYLPFSFAGRPLVAGGGARRFYCDLCQYSTVFRRNLTVHRRIHTGERPYSCRCCARRFTHKSGLNRHMRTHGDLAPRHECPHCAKSFLQSGHLDVHVRSAHGPHAAVERDDDDDCHPIDCPLCGHTFPGKAALTEHVQSHVTADGVLLYPCVQCDEVFGKQASLEKHVHSAHPPNRKGASPPAPLSENDGEDDGCMLLGLA